MNEKYYIAKQCFIIIAIYAIIILLFVLFATACNKQNCKHCAVYEYEHKGIEIRNDWINQDTVICDPQGSEFDASETLPDGFIHVRQIYCE